MKHLLALGVVVAAACSGGQKAGTGNGSGSADTGTGSGTAVVAADAPITRGECEAMVGHILDVGIAEKKKSSPPEKWPTDEQVENIRKSMIADEEGMKQCLAFDRPVLICVMNAADTAALSACLGPEG